jgi:hypothetical protein
MSGGNASAARNVNYILRPGTGVTLLHYRRSLQLSLMSTRQTAILACVAALIVSGTVLALLWRYGIWEIMALGNTDLRLILWPSSIMITVGWCSTAAGIMTTISSIAINCLLYIGIALLLRRCYYWIRGPRSA